jgi:hypothetical protein
VVFPFSIFETASALIGVPELAFMQPEEAARQAIMSGAIRKPLTRVGTLVFMMLDGPDGATRAAP